MQQTIASGLAFFRQPEAEKLASRLPLDTGYRPYGQEYSASEDHPDEVESFTASRRLSNAETKLGTAAAHALNERLLVVFDEFETMARRLVDALSAQFGVRTSLPETALTKWSLLQMNFSRPSSTSSQFINDLHEDGCLLTVMSLLGPGLELQTKNANFLPVSPHADGVLLMAGEILNLISGGRIRAVHHRVRTVKECRERLALLFFADMDPQLCSPWIRNGTNAGIDIGKRVLQNSTRFGLAEWTYD